MNQVENISVVIPCYRSTDSLNVLCDRLVTFISDLNMPYEIILVNDGSPDDTWNRVLSISEKHRAVSAINLSRNYGQHNALLCGIRRAKYDTIVTIDDDLQTPPEEIAKLVQKFNEGYDVVYGIRAEEKHGLFRNIASVSTKLVLAKAMGAHIARNITSFRIFRTRLKDAFEDVSVNYVSIDVLLTWATTSFSAVEVDHQERQAGQSNYTLAKLITHTINMVTGFSTLPLRIASTIGFFTTLFGLVLLTYVLGRYFIIADALQGFTFLASSITIFAGAQLLALGIIGEYMARIYARSLGKPPYVVKESRESSESTKEG